MAFKVGNTEVFNDQGNLQTAGLFDGYILQCVSFTTQTNLSGTLGGASDPGSSDGTSYFSFQFTPLLSDSDLLLYSSNICVWENSDSNDVFYLAAYFDTTRISIVNAPVRDNNARSSLTRTYLALNKAFSSWGTSQKTIDIRIGSGNGTGSNMVVNTYLDTTYTPQHETPEISFTMIEYRKT